MRPRFIVTAIILLTAWMNLNCRKLSDRPSADSSTITVLYPWDERVLGPYMDVGAKFLVFLPLFYIDEHGHIQEKLAERWEHSEDYRSWTFYLRKDVKWHDGVRTTAHDIKFTLELISRPEILYDDAWLGMQSITVHDDHSLTITFESPKDFRNTWLVYWPKHLLENLDPKKFREWDFWLQPIGNGPYRFVRQVPKTMMEFEANEDYYAGKPQIERVILKFGSSSLLTELLSGNVDAIPFFNRSDIIQLANQPQFRTYYAIPSFHSLAAIHWNLNNPLFADPQVRRALTMAIDRKQIQRVQNMPEELKIFDVIFTGHQYRHDEIPPPLPYDPEAAAALLDKAGWQPDASGIRKRNGKEFRFDMAIPSGYSAAGDYRGAAVLIQAQLRQIGIHMDIQEMEEWLLYKRIEAGQIQAAMHRFYQGPNMLLKWFGADSPLGYSNHQVFDLLKEYQVTADPDEVNRIVSEIQPLMLQDLPLTFLFLHIHTCVAHKRIQGLISPYRSFPVQHMEYLWIEEGADK